jgi:hypothetical protein
MSRRTRDRLVGLALALVASAGLLWQVERSGAAAGHDERTSVPRLLCPLH